MDSFTYNSRPGRVVFGQGSIDQLAHEVDAFGARRVLLVGSPDESDLLDRVTNILGERVAGQFNDVAQHVPAPLAKIAVETARRLDADAIVTVGGGSATGFGKIIRLEHEAALLAVPTTYAGSEMTPIWGQTTDGDKHTGIDPRVQPATVVYDPLLTMSLPARIAGPSGMNAMAHCVEALYGPGSNPVISLMALEGIRALAAGLPVVCSADDGIEARSDVLYGAYLAGVALASGGTALHHKSCHVLGGMFDLNHGDMNSVLLGHALAYNSPALGTLMDDIARALGVDASEAPGALFDLARAIGAPTSLAEIGMPSDGLDEAARRIVVEAAANVRPPDEDSIRIMLDNAFAGRRP